MEERKEGRDAEHTLSQRKDKTALGQCSSGSPVLWRKAVL